jgi:ATP-dependent Clp protease ATP-binding subunit ClpA
MNLDKFTQKAQEAVLDAQRLAQEYNHQQIEAEHLLAALLRQSDGVAPQVVSAIAAATLSHRYITDRQLPDKAIDLIDEAASRLRMEIDSKPQALDEVDRAIMQSEIEAASKKRSNRRARRSNRPSAAPTWRPLPACATTRCANSKNNWPTAKPGSGYCKLMAVC